MIVKRGGNVTIMDGKMLRDKILDEVKDKIEKNNLKLKLAIILVGDNEASKIYVRNKEKACEYVGVKCDKYLLDKSTSEGEIINLIDIFISNEFQGDRYTIRLNLISEYENAH